MAGAAAPASGRPKRAPISCARPLPGPPDPFERLPPDALYEVAAELARLGDVGTLAAVRRVSRGARRLVDEDVTQWVARAVGAEEDGAAPSRRAGLRAVLLVAQREAPDLRGDATSCVLSRAWPALRGPRSSTAPALRALLDLVESARAGAENLELSKSSAVEAGALRLAAALRCIPAGDEPAAALVAARRWDLTTVGVALEMAEWPLAAVACYRAALEVGHRSGLMARCASSSSLASGESADDSDADTEASAPAGPPSQHHSQHAHHQPPSPTQQQQQQQPQQPQQQQQQPPTQQQQQQQQPTQQPPPPQPQQQQPAPQQHPPHTAPHPPPVTAVPQEVAMSAGLGLDGDMRLDDRVNLLKGVGHVFDDAARHDLALAYYGQALELCQRALQGAIFPHRDAWLARKASQLHNAVAGVHDLACGSPGAAAPHRAQALKFALGARFPTVLGAVRARNGVVVRPRRGVYAGVVAELGMNEHTLRSLIQASNAAARPFHDDLLQATDAALRKCHAAAVRDCFRSAGPRAEGEAPARGPLAGPPPPLGLGDAQCGACGCLLCSDPPSPPAKVCHRRQCTLCGRPATAIHLRLSAGRSCAGCRRVGVERPPRTKAGAESPRPA